MANPPFENVGQNTKFADDGGHKFLMVPDPHYRAFWYRRTFTVDGEVPPVAVLKIAKAKFGTRVWLNGEDVGEHWPCYTPGYFDVRQQLKGNGQSNELIVRVHADPLAVGDRVANGFDFEKHSYLAGIYDDVTLTLTGSPRVVNVQVVPEVDRGAARVVAELRNDGKQPVATGVAFEVRPYERSQVVGRVTLPDVRLEPGQTRSVEARIPIRDCKLWSPEAPNLYHLVTRTNADALLTRFGMRRFHFDPTTTIGVLNGKPCYLRGSNVCYFRFEEDPLRADKPWDEQWVRRLHRRFKSLDMNALRYCIGFPPEMWYRIADEEGIIIQDEFPIWTLGEDDMTRVGVEALAAEYRDWMREHWNHACVLIWDAQNECRFDKTREALGLVRNLDLSNRPWDNGWGKPQQPADIKEDHPYQYSRSMAVVHWNPELKPLPTLDSVVDRYSKLGPDGPRPRIVNEYAWLWLQRDGQPTTLTRAGYAAYLPDANADKRREFYARCLSAMTEALRASRRVAGVLHFCGLGHSWDGCATSDNFIDLNRLAFEPHFQKHMQYVFAPVGIMLRVSDTCQAGKSLEVRVVVFNDLGSGWNGDVTLLLPDGEQETVPDIEVAPYDRTEVALPVMAPSEPGRYDFCAKIIGANDKVVLSRRIVAVTTNVEGK
ncbi:hypothetical protein BV582_22770 [Bacillus paralicheniformis]|nr:hypothetical protein BV582_22770 [Bacillus paralicheniformis]